MFWNTIRPPDPAFMLFLEWPPLAYKSPYILFGAVKGFQIGASELIWMNPPEAEWHFVPVFSYALAFNVPYILSS